MKFSEETLSTIDEFLKLGGSLHVPYKKELLEWYDEHGIVLSIMGGKYSVFSHRFERLSHDYDTLKEAIKEFEFYTHPKNNIGLALQIVFKDHPELQNEELDYAPTTKKVRNILRQKKYNI